MPANILIIGSGGREHAIIHSLLKSPKVNNIYSTTSNAGISAITIPSNINPDDKNQILRFCQNNQIELVIIGAEQPLVEGLIDFLQTHNIRTFGPSKQASQLEGSKIFMKNFCHKYNIPTAQYNTFDDQEKAIAFLNKVNFPIVIKTDGLAAGKGVIISQSYKDAKKEIIEMFSGKFGDAGKKIIIEEFLEGDEVSFFTICDGHTAKFFTTAGDHKRALNNDQGLNTGGMGAYSPSPFINESLKSNILTNIINPTISAMQKEGSPFIGFLFAGIILTKNGPKLLEFNIRLGDPEAEAILPRLESDLFDIINLAIDGKLDQSNIIFNNKKSVCVILTSKDYPLSYKKDDEIHNLKDINTGSSFIFHCGTKEKDGKILTNGGRVLAIVAIADDFITARNKSYELVSKVKWDNCHFRTDIAAKIL